MPTKKKIWKNTPGKSWRSKLERIHPGHGKVVRIPPKMQKRLGAGTLLIPRPLDVDAALRTVRPGRLTTLSHVRAQLAVAARADHACPLCTGIFARIAAETAEEDRMAGKSRITPWWRLLKDDGSLNPRYPGGPFSQAAKLRKEGFSIRRNSSGSILRVRDFEKFLPRSSSSSRPKSRARNLTQ